MLDGDTFDALEYVAREVRQSHEAFGGIRLVLSGDFFQARSLGLSRFLAEARTHVLYCWAVITPPHATNVP